MAGTGASMVSGGHVPRQEISGARAERRWASDARAGRRAVSWTGNKLWMGGDGHPNGRQVQGLLRNREAGMRMRKTLGCLTGIMTAGGAELSLLTIAGLTSAVTAAIVPLPRPQNCVSQPISDLTSLLS